MEAGAGKRIAVTGGIGSGKSRVSLYWSTLAGLPLIDVDGLCAALLEKGNAGWQAVKDELGTNFLLRDGRVDRKRLRSALFSDERVRQRMNDLIHPLAFAETIAAIRQEENRTVLVDVPLLFEAGWENHFDYCVVVYADPEICCRRVADRDRIGFHEARQSFLTQLPVCEKILRADHVINNSGNWVSTILEINHLSRVIVSECKVG